MSTTPLQRLRKSYSFADLPDTIVTGRDGGGDAKPIELATVDDIAFAMQALTDRANTLYNTQATLRSLHDQARRTGALGSALAVDAVAPISDAAR